MYSDYTGREVSIGKERISVFRGKVVVLDWFPGAFYLSKEEAIYLAHLLLSAAMDVTQPTIDESPHQG